MLKIIHKLMIMDLKELLLKIDALQVLYQLNFLL